MTNLNNLFTADAKETKGKRALSGTAEMTANAEVVVNDVLEALSNSYDDHAELFEQSKVDANAMDMLISEFTNKFEDVDVSFLEKYDEDELKSMLKSQQSKRSRSKSKDMTMDNYKSMMNAAVCELMIRTHTGNAKTRTAGRGSNMYTDEFLNSMAEDQHELRRELRNVQSKMCIFRKKHPEDFSEFDEYKELEKPFFDFATERGMVGIKGHRSVGGFRASCYNAQTIEGVNALVQAMKDFEAQH